MHHSNPMVKGVGDHLAQKATERTAAYYKWEFRMVFEKYLRTVFMVNEHHDRQLSVQCS